MGPLRFSSPITSTITERVISNPGNGKRWRKSSRPLTGYRAVRKSRFAGKWTGAIGRRINACGLWIIRPNPITNLAEIIELKADKFSIGTPQNGQTIKFTNHQIDLQKGDLVYLFSDGFHDQVGGPNRKKFLKKSFKELLLKNYHLPLDEQKDMMEETIITWQGKQEQTDDILVIGMKI